jgi:hypothetical protein
VASTRTAWSGVPPKPSGSEIQPIASAARASHTASFAASALRGVAMRDGATTGMTGRELRGTTGAPSLRTGAWLGVWISIPRARLVGEVSPSADALWVRGRDGAAAGCASALPPDAATRAALNPMIARDELSLRR